MENQHGIQRLAGYVYGSSRVQIGTVLAVILKNHCGKRSAGMETKVKNGKDYRDETEFIDQRVAEIFFPISLFDNIPKAANQGSFGEDFAMRVFALPDCPQRGDAQRNDLRDIHNALSGDIIGKRQVYLEYSLFLDR